MTSSTILGVKLDGRKVLDVVFAKNNRVQDQRLISFCRQLSPLTSVEKHVSHSGSLSVHLERMPGQDDTLGHDSGGVSAHERSHSDQVRAW
jgi:hypothetical protein